MSSGILESCCIPLKYWDAETFYFHLTSLAETGIRTGKGRGLLNTQKKVKSWIFVGQDYFVKLGEVDLSLLTHLKAKGHESDCFVTKISHWTKHWNDINGPMTRAINQYYNDLDLFCISQGLESNTGARSYCTCGHLTNVKLVDGICKEEHVNFMHFQSGIKVRYTDPPSKAVATDQYTIQQLLFLLQSEDTNIGT